MMGRLRIQVFGFLGVGTCFIISAAAFHPLTTPGGKGTFQFLYFFSSFLVGRCASALQGLMRKLHLSYWPGLQWRTAHASVLWVQNIQRCVVSSAAAQ